MENVVAFASFERNTITTMCVLQPKGFPFNIKINIQRFFIHKLQAVWAAEQITCWREKLTSRLAEKLHLIGNASL